MIHQFRIEYDAERGFRWVLVEAGAVILQSRWLESHYSARVAARQFRGSIEAAPIVDAAGEGQ